MSVIFPSSKSLLQQLNLEKDQIKSQFAGTRLHQYVAVYNWLTLPNPPSDAPRLKQIEGYLEAFHHLCEVEDWQRARQILSLQLDSPNQEELHQLLNTWGYYQEQVNALSRLVDKIPEHNASILLLLGEAHNFLGQSSKSQQYFAKAQAEIDSNPDVVDRATVLDGLGGTYLLQGDYERAFNCLKQALELIETERNSFRKQSILENLGKVYFYGQRDYQKALNSYEQSLLLAREVGNLRAEAALLAGIGHCYLVFQELAKAEDSFQSSLNLAERLEDPQLEGVAHEGMGLVLLAQNKYAEAIDRYEQRLELSKRTGDLRSEGEAICQLANVYYRQGDLDKSFACFTKSQQIFLTIGNRQGERATWVLRGMIYQQQKKHQQAIEYLEKGLEIARSMGDAKWESVNLLPLAISYLAVGNIPKGFGCLWRSFQLKR